MAQKKIIFRIYTNGEVRSSTNNIKGPACRKYIPLVSKIADAQVVDQSWTGEYYEQESILTEETEEIAALKEDR